MQMSGVNGLMELDRCRWSGHGVSFDVHLAFYVLNELFILGISKLKLPVLLT